MRKINRQRIRNLNNNYYAHVVISHVVKLKTAKMASSMVFVCRFCCNTIQQNNYTALFSPDALDKDLPGRLSALLQFPVSSDDGHSPQCCRSCMRKFLAAETFVSKARNSYEKINVDGVESSAVMLRLQVVRKRGKDI